MSTPKITVLIVDDEPLAREKISTLLRDEGDFELIGECENGLQAVEAIRRLRPDLVFLDVQMPGMTGVEVLRCLEQEEWPAVVFVTAFDEYAVEAFELNAQDYLLKPFDFERFKKTLDRLHHHIRLQRTEADNSRLQSLLQQLRSEATYRDRLMIKSRGDIYFLKTSEIDWIEAAGNYINIHTGRKTHLLRESMSNIEAQLDPRHFIRIHRSKIVNIEQVAKLHSDLHGEYFVTLKDGTCLVLSRTYRRNMLRHFNKNSE